MDPVSNKRKQPPRTDKRHWWPLKSLPCASPSYSGSFCTATEELNNFSFKNKILSVTMKSMDEVTEQTHCHELCCWIELSPPASYFQCAHGANNQIAPNTHIQSPEYQSQTKWSPNHCLWARGPWVISSYINLSFKRSLSFHTSANHNFLNL